MKDKINLTKAEIQSGSNRVRWAEGLIIQLPKEHEGRNSWLLNYGVGVEAVELREKRNLKFLEEYQACETSGSNEATKGNSTKWLPKTLEEIVDFIIETLSDKDKEIMVKDDTMLHHGFGTNVRNSFNLWHLEKENPELYKYCCSIGVKHGDDLSMIITNWIKSKIMGVEYNLDKDLISIWKHWRNYNEDLLPINIDGVDKIYLNLFQNNVEI